MKTFFKTFIIGFLIFTTVLVPIQWGLNAIGGIRLFSGTENLTKDMPTLVDKDSPFFKAFKNKKRVNVLLLGVNSGMTDTLMLGSYDLKSQKVDIISIPRDTYYPRDKAKSPAAKKINAIYQKDKAVGTAMAVSDVLMGMPINYYVVVEYEGVKKIVNSMGGVPMNIPFHMYYKDPYDTPPLKIDIPKGDRLLNGDKSVEFLRFRKGSHGYQGYPEGDIGRVKAQQEFVKSAFRQAIGFSLPKVTTTVLNNVDSDLPLGMATKIATKALGLTGEDMETYTIPGESGTKNGASYWYVDKDAVEELLMQIYQPETER